MIKNDKLNEKETKTKNIVSWKIYKLYIYNIFILKNGNFSILQYFIYNIKHADV